MRLAAVGVAANEWPMIGCSVLSLLEQGVDEVILVDCGSQDESVDGLRRLREAGWPVTVIEEPKATFRQAALTNLLWQVAVDRGADWTLPFDADEFFLVEGGGSLREEIGAADTSMPIRYKVRNFVLPTTSGSFDYGDLATAGWAGREMGDAYSGSNLPKPEVIGAIGRGEMPFVCAPFPSKLVLPTSLAESCWIDEGAHFLRGHGSEVDDSTGIVMAHVPFRSREALGVRATQALAQTDGLRDGSPPLRRGFQVAQLAEAEKGGPLTVDDWWRLNSVPEGGDSERFEPDDRLAGRARALLPTFESELGQAPEGPATGPSPPEPVTESDLVRAAARAGRAIEEISMGLSDRERELEGELYEDRLERDSLRHQLEAATRALDEIRGSRAWRLTGPLRSTAARASSVFGRGRRRRN